MNTRMMGIGLALSMGLASQSGWAAEELDLKAIMVQLGQQMNQINDAIFADDLDTVRHVAGAIADHPRPPASERQQILAVLGEDGVRFRAADHQVHEAAEALGQAAAEGDRLRVLHFYHRVMQGCVACHTEFRPRLTQPVTAD